MGMEGAVTGDADVRLLPDRDAATSPRLPQAWQAPQRPAHFAVSHPHSLHR
jgi:hypothetical protein